MCIAANLQQQRVYDTPGDHLLLVAVGRVYPSHTVGAVVANLARPDPPYVAVVRCRLPVTSIQTRQTHVPAWIIATRSQTLTRQLKMWTQNSSRENVPRTIDTSVCEPRMYPLTRRNQTACGCTATQQPHSWANMRKLQVWVQIHFWHIYHPAHVNGVFAQIPVSDVLNRLVERTHTLHTLTMTI